MKNIKGVYKLWCKKLYVNQWTWNLLEKLRLYHKFEMKYYLCV